MVTTLQLEQIKCILALQIWVIFDFGHSNLKSSNNPLFLFLFFFRDATSTTILQHFYNKSQVVSCYWFEFETNSKITFLSQQ